VVGIGASAGGLEAATALLGALPADTGMAFVLVQHLSPIHRSMLTDILSRVTRMPVTEVHDELPIEPDHVYVIAPGQSMTILGGALQSQPRKTAGLHHPIDQFLRSLANDRGHLAVGVILSGTATDGTLGLGALKAEGGITFAQDDAAQHTSMPRSAIAAGYVDFVLPPSEIAKEIVRISRHQYVAPESTRAESADDPNMSEVFRLLQDRFTVDFTDYKGGTLYRRITRRMVLHNMQGLDNYVELLRETPDEVDALYQDLLIGVTSFFRNPEAFEQLKTQVLPRLVGDRSRMDPLRVWVLGCSTGEEAYSLAMAVTEVAETSGLQVPLQVFATDLNPVGIEKARAGVYSKDIAHDVSPERLRRFFWEVDGSYRIVKSIRDACVFSRQNMLGDPPFSRMDLVSCRNVLIYLKPVLQQRVLSILHYALKPQGFLWLGQSESIGAYGDLFLEEDGKHKIYAKRPEISPLPPPQLSLQLRPGQPEVERSSLQPHLRTDVLKESDRILLAKFAPPAVLVSPEMEIAQYRGETSPYLAPSPGRASLNLLKMLRDGLVATVRAAILRAKRDGVAVREEGVSVRSDDGGCRNVAIEVIPVKPGGFLVVFEEPADEGPSSLEKGNRRRDQQATRPPEDQPVERLTQELADTRDYLQSVIEQLEATNEELQSANEEVQSSNEELQSINEELETSREEIQSSNEELATVNDELQTRNIELSQANNDLVNLFAAASLPILMVGPDLRIRRFTAAAATLLSLLPGDVNRPITDIRFKMAIPNLEDLLRETIDTVTARDLEIQDELGRWYSLRMRPYKMLDNTTDGAVVELVDIDALRRSADFARSVIATVQEPLVVLDGKLCVRTANLAFLRLFGHESGDIDGRSLCDLGRGEWNIPELRRLLEEIVSVNGVLNDFEMYRDVEGVGRRTLVLNARRLVHANDTPPLILLSIADVTDRKAVEEMRLQHVAELIAADHHRNEFLAMLAHELRNSLAPIRVAAAMLANPDAPAAACAHAGVVLDRQICCMSRLIEDLLDISRVTQGKIELRKAPVDLIEILKRSVDLVQQQVLDRHQTVSVSLPSAPVYVDGDTARLEQVFGNLLNNASKFTPKEGHIWVSAANAELGDGRKTVLVRVTDDGVGLAPEALPHVFDLFSQSGHSLHPGETGLGIGLTLVQRLVALHDGSVHVQSAGIDHGSEFMVSLPVLEDSAPQATTATSENAQYGEIRTLRILVVDDNEDAAEGFAALLRLADHDVRVVYDGASALQIATTFVPEVVFLDICMPSMDGYEVVGRLRQLPALATAFFVAVTGCGRDEDRQQARGAGFDEHVTKPLDPIALPQLLARVARSVSVTDETDTSTGTPQVRLVIPKREH
jgi:two-component system CheB/CheR fusion protein